MSSVRPIWVLSLLSLGHTSCWPEDGTGGDDAEGLKDAGRGGQHSGLGSPCSGPAEIHIRPASGSVYTYEEAYPAQPTTPLADWTTPAFSYVVYFVDPGVTVVVAIREDGTVCARNQWDLGCGERVDWEVDSFPLEFVDNACAAE